MTAGRVLAALVGFAAGAAVVVATLALELMARDLPVRGGLSDLQMQSVAVWVLESVPFLLAFAAAGMARPAVWGSSSVEGETTSAAAAPASTASAPDEPVAPPPPPPLADGATAPPPPPLPADLQSANVLGVALEPQGGADSRLRAMQELVKVLRANAARAAEDSRSKSEYLANMSAELRTPLNAIIGYAQRMLDEELGASEAEQSLHEVHQEARRLVVLLNNILDLSKIEVGNLSIVLEDVDLAQVVDEARVAVGGLLPPASSLIATIKAGARFARGDHMRVRQILVNLVTHVASPEPPERLEVMVEPATLPGLGAIAQGAVAVRVSDDRPLTRSQIENLFREYHESDVSEVALGLALGRKMAELMGGTLEVQSDASGSVFTLLLPSGFIEEAQVPARSTVALNERLSGLGLVLADHDPSASALARYLERAGLLVAHVRREPVLAALQEREPHIAVIDASIEGAWQAAEWAVEQGIKVVILSLRDEDVEQALQLGVAAFLARPVERPLVLATLERCLEEG